jgi:GT2 family glycosyltransferase
MIDVSIIMVSFNSLNEIIENIASIRKNITSLNYEIIIVNNYAQDHNLSIALKNYDHVKVIEAGSNLGFGRANNLGLALARGKYVLFVNPDVIFLSDINQLTDILDHDPEVGLIGPITYDGKGKLLSSCGEYPNVKNFLSHNLFLNNLFPRIKYWGNFSMKYFDFKGRKEVDWISGAFMLGRKSTLDRIGGFDEDFFMYCEDVDICWRLKENSYKVIFCDKASIIHKAGHSIQNRSLDKAKMIAESSRILWSKHYDYKIVRRLFLILCIGSFIRNIGWSILNIIAKSKQKNLYYKTLVSESIKYIKGVNLKYG